MTPDEGTQSNDELPPISWELLQEGLTVPGDSGCPMGELPPWLDRDSFYRGQKVCRDNYALSMSGLIAVLTLSYTEEHLFKIFSKLDSHRSSQSMAQRFHETVVYLTKGYDMDFLEEGGQGYQSLLKIRAKHKHYIQKFPKMFGEHPKGHQWLSQTYMAFTQIALIGPLILQPYGIAPVTGDDLEDLAHFWRVLGYMLGISERYNVCRDGGAGLLRITKQAIEEVAIPSALSMTAERKRFVQILCDSMMTVFFPALPAFTPVMYIAAELLNNCGLSAPKLTAEGSLNWRERFCVNFALLMVRYGVHTWTPVRLLTNAILRWKVRQGPSRKLSTEPFWNTEALPTVFTSPMAIKSE